MTVSTTGSVSEEVEPEFTHHEALAWLDDMRHSLDVVRERVIVGWRRRVWISLGYATWQAMCDAEFTGAMIRLPRADRPAFVRELRGAGMSSRAIAAALGVSQDTAARDARTGERNRSPDTPPPRVTGTDGKQYAGRAKAKASKPEPPPTPPVAPSPPPPSSAPVNGGSFVPTWFEDVLAAVYRLVRPENHASTRAAIYEQFLSAVLDSLGPNDRKIAIRTLAKVMHPDLGGDVEAMKALTVAMEGYGNV